MPTTAKDFFGLMVEPTVTEFTKSPYDLRRGLLAALVLHHMVDYLAVENATSTDRKSLKDLLHSKRKHIIEKCPEFEFIRDVADATKHCKLSTDPKKPRDVPSSSQLSGTPGMFEAPFGEGVFAEAAEVYVVMKDNSNKLLLPAITTLFDTLRSEIQCH